VSVLEFHFFDPVKIALGGKIWMARARSSGIRILIQFANTLGSHKSGLLSYYDQPISTGPLEGTNNKIKTMLLRSSKGLSKRPKEKMLNSKS
jgi:hypothetical protein